MEDKREKLIFIHQLRAIATLMVMVWHLTIMFWYSNETISALFYLKPVNNAKERLNFLYANIVDALRAIGLDFGGFGVAIFFLISGFIIPYSLKNVETFKQRLIFLFKRIMRIWPAYICGFSIGFAALYCYEKLIKSAFPYSIKEWLIQASLCRDWFWVPSIDGISWTLEKELKFYILIFILLLLGKLYNKYWIAGISVIMTLFNIILYANTEQLILYNVRIYQIMSVLGDSFIYLQFILVGFAFYCFHSRKWDKSTFFIILQFLTAGFLLSAVNSTNENLLRHYIVNYFGAFLLFTDFYLMRDKLKENRLLNFLGDKSYAIYLLHGTNGYILLSILAGHGLPFLVCILVTVSAVLIMAALFNRYVEKPIQHATGYLINRMKQS